MSETKLPEKCEHCNSELVCCEDEIPYIKDSQIIEARKCPECERAYYIGSMINPTWVPR